MVPKKLLYKSALRLLNENLDVKRNERVLLLTDRSRCRIFDSILEAASNLGINISAKRISGSRSNSAPLPHLRKEFRSVDVIVAPTEKSISHSPQTRLARKKHGVRVASMPSITEELFLKAFDMSTGKQKKINSAFINALKGRSLCITSKAGTDLRIRIAGHKFDSDDGDCSAKGSLRNIPSGEVSIAPISAINGKLVVDVWKKSTGKNIEVLIKNGWITGSSREAYEFISFLKKHGRCALRTVELGIGTNPMHKKPTGSILHDEKILGSAHIAFGGYGNLRKCPIHQDVMILCPTIKIDGRDVMKNGRPCFKA